MNLLIVTQGAGAGGSLILQGMYAQEGGGSYLGRFRQGDVVTATFTAPGRADGPPTAVLAGPTGTVFTRLVPSRDGTTFTLEFMVTASMGVGSYTLSCTYTSGGTLQTALFTLDVIPGGDPDGAAIGTWYIASPSGGRVLIQSRSGRFFVGSNPTA